MTGNNLFTEPKNYIDDFFNSLSAANLNTIQYSNNKLKKLKEQLIRKYGSEFTAAGCEFIIKNQLLEAVHAYAFGLNHLVYVELHSIIERIVIMSLPQIISKDPRYGSQVNITIGQIIDKSSLNNLVPILESSGVWDKADIAVIRLIIRKRNAIAHLNFEAVSRQFSKGEDANLPKVKELLKNDNKSISAIVDSVQLIYKVISFSASITALNTHKNGEGR